ncbi:uncharacterized protein K452DRAFT_299261 [Aplosporella prunicola CBS 121167]|uniref:Elongator complex protein 2 n=1 Tax=Aplosporella prunicola CBS 121167 TaxID=1176127 RepID=A0A6A6B8L6_9PEZI|nr:uncharacterized protein K452DRAFT_299261 [Aplosporella prunicola CBS 121167]KAF2140509.1 hypothetical protein K452DRAFT_299261 [Aplosporella prunicola CBS 121167]
MVKASARFVAAGGNRHPTAADWDPYGSGLLAFGAGNNVALWNPLDPSQRGCYATLCGHTKTVNVVKFLPTSNTSNTIILSGAADNTIRVWTSDVSSPTGFQQKEVLSAHTASINCIAVLPGSDIFVSGAADATIRTYKIERSDDGEFSGVQALQTIDLKQKPQAAYFPMTISLARLSNSSLILASAGTKNNIQIYTQQESGFTLAATLKGHEDWIRSLAFIREGSDESSDLLLSSASQDKYIRLWRIHQGEELPEVSKAADNPALGALGKSLHNKAHIFSSNNVPYSITFEALLVGHEDWIYSSVWRHQPAGTSEVPKLQLLSASADNSISIWEADPLSGVWVCITRLGEISAQKGATTATGSTGGFWIGLWSPDGNSVVSLGRTGSWRLWSYGAEEDRWTQRVAITGHVKSVRGISWSNDGSYLLSTSADQTTRQFAQWQRDGQTSWHEFSRPQIHGYDLNCVDVITPLRFVSGADEKLLRVFDQPAAVANLIEDFAGVAVRAAEPDKALPDAANIPVLGLSNKAIEAVADDQAAEEAVNGDADEREAVDPASVVHKSTLNLAHPPLEDHLARHLLWPETEKLYGHGYEISTVAASHDGTVVATACRATSIEHAVIRLYETKTWRQVSLAKSEASADETGTPTMKLHSLTVTGLEFSPDDEYLLSVGRDRLFGLWKRSAPGATDYALALTQDKAHTRMLLDASWAPLPSNDAADSLRIFATAGRDSKVKLWHLTPGSEDAGPSVANISTLPAEGPVTAVAFCPALLPNGTFALAYGTEKGAVTVAVFSFEKVDPLALVPVEAAVAPSDAVNELAWRPAREGREGELELAVASEDGSVRIFGVELESGAVVA